MLKVTYIEHSGFLLETETASFLFDYYKGPIPKADPQKPFLVFVSHKHPDHYNPKIFELADDYPQIQYFLSKDIPTKWLHALTERLHIMSKHTVLDIRLFNGTHITIETLKSTDAGVAYLITDDTHVYYHAGDLNLWTWEGESKQYNNNMTSLYYKELENLKNKKIDIAFVPLDPRQEKNAFGGMEAFLQYTDSSYVFPMHFWGSFSIISLFLAKHPEYQDRIVPITHAPQEFILSES